MKRLALIPLILALIAPPAFATSGEDARADHLYTEIRCLVCQGESIADSDAAIAADLRREVRADIEKGMSDAEIRKSLYTRYGDYVLFRPRLSPLNLILWFLPPLIVAAGAAWLVLRAGKPGKSENYALSSEEREKLDSVLKE
jgi:cytochrome c-type biogenesis protein CcmH